MLSFAVKVATASIPFFYIPLVGLLEAKTQAAAGSA
jgi:hypothetical protein